MTKEELFQELERGISAGEISREELANRLNVGGMLSAGAELQSGGSASFSMTKMLYVLGAAIVVVGIVIFVYQIWEDIGSFGRISVTLVLGLLITAIGSFFL